MIQVETFTTQEFSEDPETHEEVLSYEGFNGRCVEDHSINASASSNSGGEPAMRRYLVEAYNAAHPGDDPKTVDDFEFHETDDRW